MVQDLPENVSSGRSALAQLPKDIASRITLQGHDFFTPQPVQGADVYLLRMILHDWPDADAIEIVRQLIAAMSEKSKLIIMDTVLPQAGSMPSAQERMLRARDMTMLEAFNSLERDAEDWKRMLAAVDENLKLHSIHAPKGSNLSLLEVVRMQ